MCYFFIGFLSDLPYFSISLFALPFHSAHLSVLLSLPTQHISLFCSPFPLSTSLCFALPPHSAHSTQLYGSPLHCGCCLAPFISLNSPVLSLTSCRLPPASRWSYFPLFPCTLTVQDHETEPQYVLHVNWTFVTPHEILGPATFCCIITFFGDLIVTLPI